MANITIKSSTTLDSVQVREAITDYLRKNGFDVGAIHSITRSEGLSIGAITVDLSMNRAHGWIVPVAAPRHNPTLSKPNEEVIMHGGGRD